MVQELEVDGLTGVGGEVDLEVEPAFFGCLGAHGLAGELFAVGFDDEVPVAGGVVADG